MSQKKFSNLINCVDWAGKISQEELLTEAKRLRLAHWKIQKDAGVDIIPSNDFALYDQVLSHIQDFGVCDRFLPNLFPRRMNANKKPTGCPRALHQGWP